MNAKEVIDEATKLFGSTDKALKWLNTPDLHSQEPPSYLLDTEEGCQEVYEKLLRIEWGVYE